MYSNKKNQSTYIFKFDFSILSHSFFVLEIIFTYFNYLKSTYPINQFY